MASQRSSRRRRAAPIGLAAGLAFAAVVAAAPVGPTARAQLGQGTEPAVPNVLAAPGLPGLPPTSPELARVEVDSAELRRAVEDYWVAARRLARARDARAALDAERTELAATQRRLLGDLASARAQAEAASARLGVLERAIGELVVDIFVGGPAWDELGALAAADHAPAVNEQARRRVLAAAALETLGLDRRRQQDRYGEARAATARLEAALGEARARLSAIEVERPAAQASEAQAADLVSGARVALETARTLSRVRGVDFTLVALDAYHRAARSLEHEQPACRLRWWGLAGVSRVEARHGTYGGARLDQFGRTAPPIFGIPLDGTNGTRLIRDTDGGALDRDPVLDRAVGPMQFIPSTWVRFAADGDGDGVADPHNLYDATLAAARYLCRASAGLDGDAGLRVAYFAYNRSLAYVEAVLGFARGYERTVAIP